MNPAKLILTLSVCCLGGALHAQEAPATATPAPVPVPKAPAANVEPTEVKPAETKKPSILDAFKKQVFSRTAVVSLREWSGGSADAPKTPVATDANTVALNALRRDVAMGNWKAVGAFFTEYFQGNPEEAKQAFQFLLESLVRIPPPQQAQAQAQPVQGQPATQPAQGRPVAQPSPQQGQQPGPPPPRQFAETNVLSTRDVLELADQYPFELDEDLIKKLGELFDASLQNGYVLADALKMMDAGTVKLGGREAKNRSVAARLLVAASRPIEAAQFLPTRETALATKDVASLNLLATSATGRFAKDGKPEDLELAWQITQDILALNDADKTERGLALRRAVELAPKVRKEFGAKWLTESFTSKPELGMEILANIGTASVKGRTLANAEARLLNLELQSRAVEALLQAAPQRAQEWTQPLTLLAMNWLTDARYTQERDTSTTRGPQLNYDAFGNVYFGDPMMQQAQAQAQGQFQAIATGKMLGIAPSEAWVKNVEPGLRVALQTQLANLNLKVKDEAAAFPYIEKIAQTNPLEARVLVDRFVEVWGENHDPNADKRRTNRYMYSYGYNPQADGIPLTRSRQERNLEELTTWVKKLRALNLGEMDESKIAATFMRTHSSAEVYRLENIEKVFGGLEQMKAPTFAAIVGAMRQNLATVWRTPKEQQAKKTRRTDKEILAEVQRGYGVTAAMLAKAEQRFPNDYKLRLARAALMLDELNFRNLQQKDPSFSKDRDAAYAVFQQAATLYAKALPTLELKDQNADTFLAWFYASLGASDLEGVTAEQTPSPKQAALIRTAIEALPGEAAARHETYFANALSTRMTAAQPAVKHRYLLQGLAIAGNNERAREARALFDYYADLVTEIKLDARIDGSDVVGTAPFGVFVDIRHTKQIEREAGGFQKYLQNQSNQAMAYNFGRPLENYRDKFESAARDALQESFEVLSVTFYTDKIESRGVAEAGWRVTPYCYFLLKAKGPQTDALPALKLNLDFLDTSGYAVLPIESARKPLDASSVAQPRPVAKIEAQQILDERKAPEGILGLEIKATGRGLVPPLESLLEVKPADFDIASIEDTGVRISQMDAGDDSLDAVPGPVSERIWNVSFRAKKNLAAPATHFAFAKPKDDNIKTTYFRYADADLQAVPAELQLGVKYGKPRSPWRWLWLTLLVPIGYFLFRSKGKTGPAENATPFVVPAEITPLSVIGLLERIKRAGKLSSPDKQELETTLASMQRHYYGTNAGDSTPDLAEVARQWIARVGKAA